jgi:chemotaxis protein histidine kinase CheA
MGGLVAADVALAFRHRIVGVINFDVPFLGLHPGIIKAGLGSIFSPPPAPVDAIPEEPPEKKPSRMDTFFNPKPSDPNFNPSFHNDVQLPVRKGWENTLHWLNKHYSKGLREGAKSLVRSHFEFGSAMADYKQLKSRYARVRSLEEDDEKTRKAANPELASPPRIRFVNYYTASTGRPKKPKSPKSPSPSRPPSRGMQSRDSDVGTGASQHTGASIRTHSGVNSPRISVEVQEYHGDEVISVTPQEPMSSISPVTRSSTQGSLSRKDSAPKLPEIPPVPQEPKFVDLMQFTNKQERKAAEKEHDKSLKEYQKAVKARNKAINERTKAEEKWEKQQAQKKQPTHQQQEEERLRKEQERMQKEHERMTGEKPKEKPKEQPKEESKDQPTTEEPKQQKDSDSTEDSYPSTNMDNGYEMRPEEAPEIQALEEDVGTMQLGESHDHEHPPNHPYGNYDFSHSAIMNQKSPDDQSSMHESSYSLATTDSNASQPPPTTEGEDAQPKKKLGKFCMLPPKDSAGNTDPTWVRVFMKNMDEVTAHTSLFFMNETYERLVGDVGAKVEDWIREADSVRVVREMGGV